MGSWMSSLQLSLCHAGEDRANKADFSDLLLQIGDGRVGGPPGTASHSKFQIPPHMLAADNTVDGLITTNFGDIQANYQQPGYLNGRAILSPKNADVDQINHTVLNMIPGQVHSADSMAPSCFACLRAVMILVLEAA